MRNRRAALVAGALLLMLCAPALLMAQARRWSTPFELSPPVPATVAPTRTLAPGQVAPTPTPPPASATRRPRFGSSWFSDIATGPEGRVYVTWYSGISSSTPGGESIDLLMFRELRNGRWTDFNDIIKTAEGGYTVRNSIAADRRGTLHAVFRSFTNIKYARAPWDKAWLPQSWSEPRMLAENAYYVELGVDSKGGLHLFWSQAILDDPQKPRVECPDCSDLFYRRSDDGGLSWSDSVNLSMSEDGENRPQVAIDSRDRIHAVWDQGVDWYAGAGVPKYGAYRRSDDGGKTWRGVVRFAPPGDAAKQVVVGVDGDDNPIVVYRSATTNDMFYQVSRDGGDTWGQPQKLPLVRARNLIDNDLDKYAMATDSAGNVHLLMVGARASQPAGSLYRLALLHLTWNGSTWSAPESVMENDLYPEWPSLAVSNGNQLHASWFTRSQDDLFQSERARYRVWYSTTRLSAPSQTSVPAPSATPELGPTAAPTELPPPPTPTPLSAAAIEAPAISGGPVWERTGLTTVVIAIGPVVLLVGLALAVRWWRGRR